MIPSKSCIILVYAVLYVSISSSVINNQLIYRLDDHRLQGDNHKVVVSGLTTSANHDTARKPVERKLETIGHNYGWYSMPVYPQRSNGKFRKGFETHGGHGNKKSGGAPSFWSEIARDNISMNGDVYQFLKTISAVRVKRNSDTVPRNMTKDITVHVPNEHGVVQRLLAYAIPPDEITLRKKVDDSPKSVGTGRNDSALRTAKTMRVSDPITLRNGNRKERRKKIFYLNTRMGIHRNDKEGSNRKYELEVALPENQNAFFAYRNKDIEIPSRIHINEADAGRFESVPRGKDVLRSERLQTIEGSGNMSSSITNGLNRAVGMKNDSKGTKALLNLKVSNAGNTTNMIEDIESIFWNSDPKNSDPLIKQASTLVHDHSQKLTKGTTLEDNDYESFNKYNKILSKGERTYSPYLGMDIGFSNKNDMNTYIKDARTKQHGDAYPHSYHVDYRTEGKEWSGVNRMGLVDDAPTSLDQHQQTECTCDNLGPLGSAFGIGVLATIGAQIAEGLSFTKQAKLPPFNTKQFTELKKIRTREMRPHLSLSSVRSLRENTFLSRVNGPGHDNYTIFASSGRRPNQSTIYAIELDFTFPASNRTDQNLNTTFPGPDSSKKKEQRRIRDLTKRSNLGVLSNAGDNGVQTHLSARSQWDAQKGAPPGGGDAQQRVTRATKHAVERNARVSASYLADYNEPWKRSSKQSLNSVEPTVPIGEQIVEFLLEDMRDGIGRHPTDLKEMQKYMDLLKTPGLNVTLNKKETARFIQINRRIGIALFFFEQNLLTSMGNASRLETFSRMWSVSNTNATTGRSASTSAYPCQTPPHDGDDDPPNTPPLLQPCDCTASTLGSLAGFTALTTLLGYALADHQQQEQQHA